MRSLVGPDQLREDPLQYRHVVVREGRREVALDAVLVAGPNAVEDLAAPVGDRDIELPPIHAAEAPLDQAILLHPVEEPRDSASAELVARDQRGDQLTQGKYAVPGPSEVHQNVEFLNGQAILREVACEAARDEAGGPLEVFPGRDPIVVAGRARRQRSLLDAIRERAGWSQLRGWAS